MTLPSAVFALQTPNLGDDLQAMAIAAFSPSIKTVFHRELIGNPQLKDAHTVVMNYWFMSKKFRKPPHPTVQPIFHGFCVGRDEMMKYKWPDYLKAHEPIGCRDHMTVELLKNRGIDAHWTGCITLFLGETLKPVPLKQRKGIFLVDVPKEAEKLIPEELLNRAVRVSNYCPKDIVHDPIARWARIARINDQLRHAELVITKRLHTSMPCVSFGTPVVLVVDGAPKNYRRFNGYQTFVPMLVHNGGVQDDSFDWSNIKPAKIPNEIKKHFEALKSSIRTSTGGLNTKRATSFFKPVRLVIPNPNLGDMPGTVRIDLGSTTVERIPEFWSDKEIVLTIDAFNAFERFEMPVSVRGYSQKHYIPVGVIKDFTGAGK